MAETRAINFSRCGARARRCEGRVAREKSAPRTILARRRL